MNNNGFTPTRPSRFYFPKADGFTRPITLLTIQDTVTYQAWGNEIGRIALPILKPNYNQATFSNRLNPLNIRYFFLRWQTGYQRYLRSQRMAFDIGFRWMAELDFASYYDLISHRQLIDLLASWGIHEDILKDLQNGLETWTDDSGSVVRGHGIPQGPITSDLLAECFLHLLDSEMTQASNIVYFRYVDDIRIMANNQKDLEEAMLLLDVCSKRLGLVLQTSKKRILLLDDTDARTLENFRPSQTTGDDDIDGSDSSNQGWIRRQFLDCFTRNGKIKDEKHVPAALRFSLFRLKADLRLLPKVFELVINNAELTEAINRYLRRFRENTRVIDFLFDYLENGATHDWHRARCLETLILSQPSGQITRLKKLCRRFRSANHHHFLRSIAFFGLTRYTRERKSMGRVLAAGAPFYLQREVLVNLTTATEKAEKIEILKTGTSSPSPSVALCAAYIISSEGIQMSLSGVNVTPWASPTLASEGLIPGPVHQDRIGDILRDPYRVKLPLGFDFRSVLSKKFYRQALKHLLEAEFSFKTQRSRFVCQMDNFNQFLVKILFNRYPGQKNKPWNNVWPSIQHSGLNHDFPTFATVAAKCHRLRTSTPEPHPYSQTLGAFAREIRVGQRDWMVGLLRAGYQEFVRKY